VTILSPQKNTDTAFDNIKNQVLDSIDSFIFTKDLSGKYTYANQAVLDLFDKRLDEVVGQSDEVFFDLKLSVQLQKNDQKVMALGIRVESEETNYIKVLNETRTYRSVKKPLFDEQGNITGMCGISTDITAEKILQIQVSEQKHLLDTILNNINAHVYMKDSDRTFLYVNSQVAELFGDKAANIIGKKDTEVLPKEMADHFYQSDSVVFKTQERQVIEETATDDEGNIHHYISTKIPFLSPDKRSALIGFSTEVTELFLLKEEFKKLATIDPLTKLFNRRYFTEQADKEFIRAQRYKLSMALISIDIDHFKSINDNFGHPAGDKVLVAVSKQLQDSLRQTDILARIGGEEFSILLPETSAASAVIFAERIRAEQAKLLITGEWQGEITLSVSIGVSSFHTSDEAFDVLFSRADKALYQAKNSGRNKVSYL
jgi:diguanylate cyclase (GGDEF)-like protein/PAS domain S-box-containing protein